MGKVESEWKEIPIEAACSLVVDCPHSTPSWTDSGVVVIRNTYLKAGRMELSNLSFTDEETYLERVRRAVPQPGDLVISREAPIGEIAMIPKGLRACLGQRVVLLRANPNVCNARFLLYSFIGGELRDEILSHDGTGSTVSNLRIPSLKAAKVKLPPLPIQRQIAAILSAFDDKIDLNRQMNRTLEQMARALFKSWFVDFDPVRAKMRGEMPEGMDAKTAALFPDELKEIEGREVPKGWTWGKIGDIATIQNGFAFKSTDWKESGIPVVKIGSVKPGIVDLQQVSYVSKEVAQSAKRFRLNIGDLVIGLTGYVGEVGFIPPTNNLPLLNQRVGRFKIHNPTNFSYLWQLVRTTAFKDAVISKSYGSAQANVSTAAIESIGTLIPAQEISILFETLVAPLIEQFLYNTAESAELAQLRDALLPRLLSGEVDVGDWEAALESAALGQP